MGRAIRDIDLLVESDTLDGAARIAEAAAPKDAQVTRHDRFATVTLQQGDALVELATARSESYAHDGALPSVTPACIEDDLLRRDFSVNALALPLSKAARARYSGIVAVEDGEKDLAEGQLRVLSHASFRDDPTRAVRAARLAPRLGFSVTRGTHSALRDGLRGGAFGRVSGERLRRDLVKIFEDAAIGLDPSLSFRLLDSWHVLGALEPGLDLPRESVLALRRLGRVVAEPPWAVARFRPWVTGFALWLTPLAPGLRRRTLRRLAVRGEASRRIASMAVHRDAHLKALAVARGRGTVDALLGDLNDEELHALYAWSTPACRRRIHRYCTEDRGKRIPVTGQDLIGLGLKGPVVGRALKRVRAAFLDGEVTDRDGALVLAGEVGRRRPRPSKRKVRRVSVSKAPTRPPNQGAKDRH
jgi:tRNA nucleotidyltransferase/poly(A) polymerase